MTTATQKPSVTNVDQLDLRRYDECSKEELAELLASKRGPITLVLGRIRWFDFYNEHILGWMAANRFSLYEGPDHLTNIKAPFCYMDEGRITVYTEAYMQEDECRVPPNSIYVRKHYFRGVPSNSCPQH